MGFLQLIPASELTAVYVSETKTLMLHARGQAQQFTTGISFHPKGRDGGERVFALMGWVGPIGQGTTPYEHRQRFENVEFPGHYVSIQTANHPKGTQVAVEVRPVLPAENAVAGLPREERGVFLGSTLELRAPVWEQLGGTVSLEQDPAFLRLKSAGTQSREDQAEIVWDFEALKVGETEVKITSMLGGITPPLATTRRIKVLIELGPIRK